ncbi:MAG TPA: SGNH/GDSL hydrolase family protein [Bacillota bacterium]
MNIAKKISFVFLIIASLMFSPTVNDVQAVPPEGPGQWMGSWTASPQQPYEEGPSQEGFANETIRLIVHPHLQGKAVRLKFSNQFGTKPLKIGKVTVAKSTTGASIEEDTLHEVRFNGKDKKTIPPGAVAVSDPVSLPLDYEEDLAVSMYFPKQTGPATWHRLSRQTSYVSAAGDYTSEASADAFPTKVDAWFYLSAVDVYAEPSVKGAIAILGDSITDGHSSTVNANHRWPDFLADRLQQQGKGNRYSVLNAGISGNKILRDSPVYGPSALARLNEDVLRQTGVTHVILLEGLNDIGHVPHTLDADEIIAGMKQIADEVRAKDVKIFAGTLTPFKGATIRNYYTEEGERTRQQVNEWIRTSGYFDGVIDFDEVLRDPNNPLYLHEDYDSGDHLHPNDAGYKAMAEAVDLSMFKNNRKR